LVEELPLNGNMSVECHLFLCTFLCHRRREVYKIFVLLGILPPTTRSRPTSRLPCNCIILRLRLVIIYTVVQNKRLDYCRQNALAQLKSCLYENRIRKSSRIDEWLYRSQKVVRNGAIQYVMMCDFLFLGPDVQNILRQSYNYLTIMPKLRSTYDGYLIYKTSYNEWKAFYR